MVDLDRPTAKPLLIAPRRPGLLYSVMDHGDCFYIRANAQARDFKVVVAPRDAQNEASWREVVPHRDGRFIADATLFRNFLVVLAREDSRPCMTVYELASGEAHDMAIDEETYALRLETVYEFDSPLLRFSLSSMDRSEEIIDYDCATRARTLVKKREVPGFDPERYLTRLVFAPAEDGESVPVSVLMKRDVGARREGAASSLRLWRLRPPGRGELLEQSPLARRSRLRLRHRACPRRNRERLGLVRGRQAPEKAQHLRRFPRRRAASDRRGIRARAASWRTARARAVC